MLLAMYQKMRLIREKNQATLDLTRFSSKYDRVSKNIEKVQKMYTSKIAALDSQAKIMQSSAKSIFQQVAGLAIPTGSAYLDPYSSTGALNGFAMQMLGTYIQNGFDKTDWDPNKGFVADENHWDVPDKVKELYQYYLTNGNINSTQVQGETDKYKIGDQEYTKDEINQFNALLQQAQREYYSRTSYVNQASSNYDTNVSLWLQAEKDRLEAEQDEAVEPLTYQQTMWELEKTQAEQRLERIKNELESYKQLCSEEAKEQAPKFGLG